MSRILHQIQDILPAAGILAVLAVIGLGVGWLIQIAKEKAALSGNREEARGLRMLDALGDSALTDRPEVFSGTVEMFQHGISDPLGSERPAVLKSYVFVQEVRTERENIKGVYTHWNTVFRYQEGVSFWLNTASGRFLLNSKDIVAVPSSKTVSEAVETGYGKNAPDHVQQVAKEQGFSMTSFGFNKDLRIYTWILRPGDQVNIIGFRKPFNEFFHIVSKGDLPVVITDQDVPSARKQLNWELF